MIPISPLSSICLVILICLSCRAEPIPAEKRQVLDHLFDRVSRYLLPTNAPYVGEKISRLDVKHVQTIKQGCLNQVLSVSAQLVIHLHPNTNRVIFLRNWELEEYVRTNGVQKIPTLSVEEALRRGRYYLDLLADDVGKDNQLCDINFNGACASCWQLEWSPTFNGYPYVQEQPYEEVIRIWFHETYGFVGYSCDLNFPLPKMTEVKVGRDFAITKAEKVVPLIQRSPYYLQCRLPGYKVSGLNKAELLIAAPNWLLDPKRAIWLRDKPPDETRLCWVVTFTSVDTKKREDGVLLVPPMFIVYVDAATGEIVGANFT